MICSNSIPAALRRSKQAWLMVGARLVCSAGARSFGAGWVGASAGRGGGNGGTRQWARWRLAAGRRVLR